MLPDADYAQYKTEHATQNGGERRPQPEFSAQNHDRSPGHRRGRVNIGAEDCRNLGQQDVANRPTAYPGDSSHQDRHERMDAVVERLLRSCHGE